MELAENKKLCCGCGACAEICPMQAITMKPDEEGFLYPVIDEDICIECGLCESRCHELMPAGNDFVRGEPVFYIAHNNDEEVIMKSASGGAFSALSDVILAEGGVVYGAVFDEEFNIVHGRAETAEERNRMRSSKYVQSVVSSGIYAQLKEDLESGRKVLFTGTPCQIAGVQTFLDRDYDNLILCDVICHSVPSPLMWREYLKMLEDENGGKITYINFRDKTEGWQRASTFKGFRYKIDDGELKKDDRFYRLFFGWKTIARPSCSACKYAQVNRPSDITIADYWGVERFAPEWKDFYGVSFILTTSPKGEELLNACRDTMRFEQRDPSEQISENHRLRGPMGIPEDERAAFWKDYQEKGFVYALGTMPL